MAIAGRVAIVPKGEWSQDVTYDKLDLVTYNGNTFIAYKSSVGVTPVDGDTWMLVMQGIDPQEIDNIVNGTTAVGNAEKLGGKLPSELSVANADTVDGYHASKYGEQGVPIINTDFGVMEIGRYIDFHTEEGQDYKARLYTDDNGELWLLFDTGELVRITTTADLANYLPKSGGTVGGLRIDRPSSTSNEGGQLDLVSPATNTSFGSDVSLDVLNDTVRIFTTNHGGIYKDVSVDFNTLNGPATLIHTGNKPTGSYTGNGSATSRTINTGGIGSAILITGSNGTTMIITKGTGIGGDGGAHIAIEWAEANFNNGTLTLATDKAVLNANGITYGYQVL